MQSEKNNSSEAAVSSDDITEGTQAVTSVTYVTQDGKVYVVITYDDGSQIKYPFEDSAQ